MDNSSAPPIARECIIPTMHGMNFSRTAVGALFLVLVLGHSTARGQGGVATLGAAIQDAIDQNQPVPHTGVAVAVIQNGAVVFQQGYGRRDLTTSTTDDVDTQTIFALGSVTKSFTALAWALLEEQTTISLNDKVHDLD